MTAVKFGFFKWLPVGVGIIGMGAILYAAPEPSAVLLGTAIVAALSLGLQIFGEVRREQAMAARAQGGAAPR